MAKLIIVAGVDGTGKTTLIEGLRIKGMYDLKFNYSYPKEVELFQNAAFARGEYKASIKIFKKLLSRGFTIICDRFHLGEYAYGPVKRNYPEWLAEEVFRLEDYMINLIGQKDIKLVILAVDDPKVILGRLKEQEYVETLAEVQEINQRYKQAALITRLSYKIFMTDDPENNPEALLKKVISFIVGVR